MLWASLADDHGNLPALEAVLGDMAGRRIDRVVNLGDCVSTPLWPAETLTLLRRHAWPTVRGNHVRYVATGSAVPRPTSSPVACKASRNLAC